MRKYNDPGEKYCYRQQNAQAVKTFERCRAGLACIARGVNARHHRERDDGQSSHRYAHRERPRLIAATKDKKRESQ